MSGTLINSAAMEVLYSATRHRTKTTTRRRRVYEAVDERMDSRRKERERPNCVETMKRFREERPKISDQFADLKRELKDVTREEWEGIPDIGDHSLSANRRSGRTD